MNFTTKVYIDWDCVDWAGAHDFEGEYDDVSDYLKSPVLINRPKSDAEIRPASIAEIMLINDDGIFYPNNESSPLYGKTRIWLPCKIEVIFDEVTYPLFYGYIKRMTFYPQKENDYAYLYLTDGTDLFSKSIITQNMDEKTVMNDGEAVDEILNAGGFSATRRSIDYDGGDIIRLPETFEFEEPA